MKVWIVSEANCTCCMRVIYVASTEEKANDYESKSTARYVDTDWYIVDEED